MRAELVEETDAAVLGAERDVVLAEEADRHRCVAVDEVRRECERDPVVVPHEAAHRRVALDACHEVVLLSSRHRRGSATRSKDVPRVPGTSG